jgi:hypothetical protein
MRLAAKQMKEAGEAQSEGKREEQLTRGDKNFEATPSATWT